MLILHGTWIPQITTDFVQSGAFYLWVETAEKSRRRREGHPYHLFEPDLVPLLQAELGLKLPHYRSLDFSIASRYFLLPTVDEQPLPSLEMLRYLETETPETFDWQYWRIDCYRVPDTPNLISVINDLHFLAFYHLAEIQLGTDLLFWYHYTQSFKQVILRDQYIPALKYRSLAAAKPRQSRSKSAQKSQSQTLGGNFEVYPGWEIIGDRYTADLQTYRDYIPYLCVAGFETLPKTPLLHDRETLLRHFSECWVHEFVRQTALPQVYLNRIENTLIEDCLRKDPHQPFWGTEWVKERYQQWQSWRDRISRSETAAPFHIAFKLEEPAKPEDAWQISFYVAPKHDPSLQISLLDFWRLRGHHQQKLRQQLGDEFEQHLLMHLGYAARIYPRFWKGLETDEPVGIFIDLDTAFNFLKEAAWVLEDAGFKVIVPAWWTPKGRRRAKVKLKAQSQSLGGNDKSKRYFSFETLVQYQYELAIGDQPVSEQEWRQLVEAKSPLVKFRGQWMELDQDKMQQMLEFWKQQQAEYPDMSLLDFMKLAAGSDENDLEVDFQRGDTLATMLTQLNDTTRLELTEEPKQFQGNLRAYQKRGLSWLHYLERLGLNGCLADDMGLGKTVQVIARLVQERELAAAVHQNVSPTLLVAPTSVLGNWYHELHKFSP